MKEKEFTYVNLGLPSGRLWASENADGYYTYDEAVEKFGDLLPPPEAFKELWEECQWLWDIKKKGMQVVGPNGSSIFLPASGYRRRTSGGLSSVGGYGYYWSAAANSRANAYYLSFYSGYVGPLICYGRADGFSVRPSLKV